MCVLWRRAVRRLTKGQIVREVMDIMRDMRQTMVHNWETLDVDHIQSRWSVPILDRDPPLTRRRCCGEYPFLFRERWEKLFTDWCDIDIEKVDPSRVSELYDSLKYDSLHKCVHNISSRLC